MIMDGWEKITPDGARCKGPPSCFDNDVAVGFQRWTSMRATLGYTFLGPDHGSVRP
jgi:hypothetical protein